MRGCVNVAQVRVLGAISQLCESLAPSHPLGMLGSQVRRAEQKKRLISGTFLSYEMID